MTVAALKMEKVSGGTWKRVKPLLLWLAALAGYYLLFQFFYNMVAFKTVFPYTGFSDMLRGFSFNILPISIIFLLNSLIVFHGFKPAKTSTKIALDVVLSNLSFLTVDLIYLLITHGFVDWAGTFFNNTIILLGIETAYYVTHFRESVRREEEQKQLALKYRYNALKAQVNPHFLFNSLNILYSLVSLGNKDSGRFIMSLSDMYRYIMAQQDKDLIPLEDELGFLDSYSRVLEMRHHNQFAVTVTGREQAAGRRIIPYTLQLLIENVAKHNIVSSRHPMTVTVEIGPDSLTVSNPIVPKPEKAAPSAVGLAYITALYQRHGRQFSVDNDGTTFKATVPLL